LAVVCYLRSPSRGGRFLSSRSNDQALRGDMRKITIMVAAVAALAGPAEAIEICSGGNRAARKVTCLVDADTGWERGVKWRLLDIDTPEISRPECPRELEIGN